jgi:diguanylate cyclase (GGDEF)-like protein
VLARSISRRIAEWRRGGAKSSLIVSRIDNLATLEAQGAAQRERALQQTSDFLRQALRGMDHMELLAGENFGILLPSAQLTDAVRTAERMRAAAEQGQLEVQSTADITLSFGVAEMMADDDEESLLLRARRALEAARRRGGNAVFVNDGVYSIRAQEVLDAVAGGLIG